MCIFYAYERKLFFTADYLLYKIAPQKSGNVGGLIYFVLKIPRITQKNAAEQVAELNSTRLLIKFF